MSDERPELTPAEQAELLERLRADAADRQRGTIKLRTYGEINAPKVGLLDLAFDLGEVAKATGGALVYLGGRFVAGFVASGIGDAIEGRAKGWGEKAAGWIRGEWRATDS